MPPPFATPATLPAVPLSHLPVNLAVGPSPCPSGQGRGALSAVEPDADGGALPAAAERGRPGSPGTT